MKNIFIWIISSIILVGSNACTTNEVKEISGTIVFNEIGDHSFNINAENIEATITMAGPNKGEIMIFENVALYRTVDYTAKIGVKTANAQKNELLNNLVVMYEAKEGNILKNKVSHSSDSGFVKIDWKGMY